MNQPDASVVVASLRRPVRLRWLLNALADQDLAPGRFEVVVVHDPQCRSTAQLLRTHELVQSGALTALAFPPGLKLPGAGRNAGLRAAAAPLILFTDDDCRPETDWVSRALAAAAAQPGSVIQGRTLPDPDELVTLFGAPWARTMTVTPPTPWAPTCNIAYPREVLDQLGGFNQLLRTGEDTDLAQRAQAAGAALVPAPEMLVYHAVEARWLGRAIVEQGIWSDLAYVAKRHLAVRRALWARIWWKPEHATLCAAAVGGAAARHWPPAATLMLPWLALSMRHRGYSPRGVLRSGSELPGRALIDLAGVAAMLRGSIRHRTLIL